MSEAVNGKDLWAEAYVMSVIESLGGAQKMADEMREYEKTVDLMLSEWDSLMKKYPDKWVAMGKERLLAVGDSMDEVLEEVEGQGLRGSEVVIEFLDTDPPILIL